MKTHTKRKLDWRDKTFLISLLLFNILGIWEKDNLSSCYETLSYQVFACDINIRVILFYLSFAVFIYLVIEAIIKYYYGDKN